MGTGELCRHSKWPLMGRHFKISLGLKLYVSSDVWHINMKWFSILRFLLTINILSCVCILQNYGGFVMDMASVENRPTSAASKREGVFAYLGKTNACIVEYEGIFGKSVYSLKSIN